MATSFDDFVDRQHKVANEMEQSIDWTKELEEWQYHLEEFNRCVSNFLQKYVDQDKVKIETVTKRIHEQYIGRYEVPAIKVEIGNNRVNLDPVGTNLFGAKGRVDMNGPNGTVRFVLVPKNSTAPRIVVRIQGGGVETKQDESIQEVTDWVWKISTPPPNIKYIELEEGSFQTAIMEVING